MYNPVIDNILYEATYQGKSKNLMEAEKYLGIIIKKLKSFEYGSREFYKYNPNNSKEIEKVKECFCKEFGFGEFDLNLDPRPVINGYTVPSFGLITLINSSMPMLPLRRGEKYYDKSHNYYCYINIFTALILELDLTPGETMAIILHEVGHNFDVSIPTVIARKAAIILTLLTAPQQLLFLDIFSYIYSMQDKLITTAAHYVPDVMKIYSKFSMLFDDISSIFADLRIVGDVIKTIMQVGVANFAMRSAIGGAGEVFADSFAVSYGYGKETVSAMDKISNIYYNEKRFKYREKLMHVKGLNTLIDAENVMVHIAIAIVDPHPQSETRMIFAIKRLEELSKDNSLTPMQRKIIKNDLEAAKKIRETNMKMEHEEERGAYASMLRKYLLDKTDGALDIKAFLLRLLPYSEA